MQDKLFESAFEYAAIGMALVGLDGRWLKTNAALCEILGYSEPELLEIDFQTLTHPDDLNADLQHLHDLLAGRVTNYQMEKRYIHKNGPIIWGLLSVSLVNDDDGSPKFFISQVQDITARKIAEIERNAFFTQTVDMLAIVDHENRLVEANPAWTKVLGWSSEELISRPLMDFLHPDDVEKTQIEANRIHAGENPTPGFCNRYLTKDLEYRWLEWSTSEFYDNKVYCCVRNVTQRVQADEALKLSELRFQDLTANVPGMVYQFEWFPVGKSRFTYVSPKVIDIMGLPPSELLADPNAAIELIHPEDLPAYLSTLKECSNQLSYRYWEGRYVLQDGRTIWTSLSAMPRQIADGGVLWTGLLQDITEQKLLNEKIAKSENLYRSLITSLSEGVMLISAEDGEVQACNQSAQKILGLTEEQLVGRSARNNNWNIIHENGNALSYTETPSYLAITSGKSIQNRILGIEIPGRGLRWLSFSAEPLFKNEEAQPYAAVTSFFDVTDVKELTQKLEYQAHVDFLTGAYSRGYFYELANIELSRAKRYDKTFSLMLLDIDYFKKINDQYGHDAGDVALKKLVVILKDTLRDLDIIGRFGGEEFIVLLPQASIENTKIIAERIRRLVSNEAIWDPSGHLIKMTISIGIAELDPAISTIDAIIKIADNALYQAKEGGRNQVFCQVA